MVGRGQEFCLVSRTSRNYARLLPVKPGAKIAVSDVHVRGDEALHAMIMP